MKHAVCLRDWGTYGNPDIKGFVADDEGGLEGDEEEDLEEFIERELETENLGFTDAAV